MPIYTHVQTGTSIFQDVNLGLGHAICVWGRKTSISKMAASGPNMGLPKVRLGRKRSSRSKY
eukprot:8618102-Karenia_brevis.AAC.1